MAWINFFGDKVRIKDIFLRNGRCLADVFYPVGSIYISAASTSPADMFGGTWEKLEGRFLLGASSAYPVNSTGGEAAHTLTVNEMPSHVHWQKVTNPVTSGGFSGRADYKSDSSHLGEYGQNCTTLPTGGGQPHNNMPPYVSVYMWQRTA